MNQETLLCCVPRIREQYNKQYTFGVDRTIKNFKNCGYIYKQVLPPVCDSRGNNLPYCVCKKSYYDEVCE